MQSVSCHRAMSKGDLPSSSSSSTARSSRVRASAMNSTTPDFTTLSRHIFPLIVYRLNTRIDTLRFRAICYLFRSLIPSPSAPLYPLSTLKICHPVVQERVPRGHFVLAQSTVYAVEPLEKISNARETTRTWMLRVRESSSGRVQLEDPLSGCRINNCPGTLPRCLSLLSYRVKEITKVYRLELVCRNKATSHRFNSRDPPFFEKVVASLCLDGTGDEFAIMAMYTGDKKLGVWGKRDRKWTAIHVNDNDFLADIVYHDEKFYALGHLGLLLTVDPKTMTVTQLMEPGRRDKWFGFGACFLVESLKDLYVVVNERGDIRVYKLDKEKLEWERVVSGLKDRVFFVSKSCSYSVSAKEFSGCKENCVYFSDEPIFPGEDVPTRPGKKAKIYDFADSPPYRSAQRLSAFPGYSKIFWPPPTWLKEQPDYICCDSESDHVAGFDDSD